MAVLLSAWPAAAQEQRGAIEGLVRDTSGAVLPGVTVEATPAGGAAINTVTDASGAFRFPSLAPGTYKVSATITGFSPQTLSDVPVRLGQVRTLEFKLALASVSETVEVTAQASAVDVTSSSVGTNISRERIELIPRGRDFTDVVGQAAGAANESQAGGISINGSSGSENRFIIDGIDTTSPQVGTNAVPMRAEFMEEVQVKSAGYAAEFGGSTGGVINAITRSGTNNFHGTILSEFQTRSWGGYQRPILIDANTCDGVQLREPAQGRGDPHRSRLLARRADPARSAVVLRLLPARNPQHRAHGELLERRDQHVRPGLQGPLRCGQRHRQCGLEAALPRRRQLLAVRNEALPPGADAARRR